MKKTHIFKAESMIEGIPIESRTIVIKKTLPKVDSLDERGMQFANEGKMLAEALFSCLPLGTIDVLLIDMLERKRSLFVINPYAQPRGKNDERD